MSDKKITQLQATSDLETTDVFVVVDGGETKQISFGDLQKEVVNYIVPVSVTAQADTPIDLGSSAYDSAELIKLSWTGGNGSSVYTLPDATSVNNTNRVIRFISDSTFHNSTHVELTPASGQTLDGSANDYDINNAYEGIMIWSDGAEWFVIQKKG